MVLLCWSSEALGLKMFSSSRSPRSAVDWRIFLEVSTVHLTPNVTRVFYLLFVQPSGYGKQTWLRMRILLWKTSWALTRLWNPTVLSEFSGVFWFLSCLDSSVLLNISWAKEGATKMFTYFPFPQTVDCEYALNIFFCFFYKYICVLVCRCILFHSDFRQQCWSKVCKWFEPVGRDWEETSLQGVFMSQSAPPHRPLTKPWNIVNKVQCVYRL